MALSFWQYGGLGMAGRRIYKFTEKTHSKRAIGSFLGGSVLLGLYIAFVYMAYQGPGGLSMYIGSVGVIAMILSVVTFGFAVTTLKEEDSFMIFPRLAAVTSFLAAVCWVGTYVIGFMM